MNFISRKIYFNQIKNFSHHPMIKFRGAKTNQTTTHSPNVKSTSNAAKMPSPHPLIDNLRVIQNSLKYRTPLTNEEIECINSGGPVKIGNWQKIKIKKNK